MKDFKVALLQIFPAGSLQGNLQKGLEYCRQSKLAGADLALFPEMWSNGYALDKIEEDALTLDSEYITEFRKLAKELNMAIGVTFLEKYEPSPRNSLVVISRHGEIIFCYGKVHICEFDPEEARLTAGEDFYVADLDTGHGTVKIGGMICYDREFPESARVLMLKGAEIILVPNACPMEINRISQLRGRAYENMVGIATVNYPYGHPDCNGHSNAFDGMAYRAGGAGEGRDTLIVEAGENEGIYMANFPIAKMREYRQKEVHGDAYRRPEKYSLLVDTSNTNSNLKHGVPTE